MDNPVAIERQTMEDIAEAIRTRSSEDYYIPKSEKGKPGGVASLTEKGKVPDEQLPDSIVTSFNGRTGEIIPQATDYDRWFAYALYAYDGVNIKEKFAGEMDFTPPETWIKQRLSNKDISGLHIKDFFEVTAGGNLFQMQIADINHDLHFMDPEITAFHIDFISKELWPSSHPWNKKNYNNGISTETCPWLASDLKAWLNSEQANVPNDTVVNPATEAVDYSSTGVWDKLPATLKNVIVERIDYAPTRYSADGLLKDDTNWAWKNIGKLWVPSETEVYGQVVWGTQNGYGVGTTHQFPIFMDGKMRIKNISNGGNRYAWWLRSVYSGNSTYMACITPSGYASYVTASSGGIAAPVCFRISG